jgi:hypothetical protein
MEPAKLTKLVHGELSQAGRRTIGRRSVRSTVAYGDFNNDGRMDMPAITGQKTIATSREMVTRPSITWNPGSRNEPTAALGEVGCRSQADARLPGRSGAAAAWIDRASANPARFETFSTIGRSSAARNYR